MQASNKSADGQNMLQLPKISPKLVSKVSKMGLGHHFPSSDYTKMLTEYLIHLTSTNKRCAIQNSNFFPVTLIRSYHTAPLKLRSAGKSSTPLLKRWEATGDVR